MANDPVAAELDQIRQFLDGGNVGEWYAAGRMLLSAVDKVLALHEPQSDRVLGSSCFLHRNALNTMVPVPGCGECVQTRQREVCPECRDGYGEPVLFQDCRARSAVLAGLTGEGESGD